MKYYQWLEAGRQNAYKDWLANFDVSMSNARRRFRTAIKL